MARAFIFNNISTGRPNLELKLLNNNNREQYANTVFRKGESP
jgi:hypothetical protein